MPPVGLKRCNNTRRLTVAVLRRDVNHRHHGAVTEVISGRTDRVLNRSKSRRTHGSIRAWPGDPHFAWDVRQRIAWHYGGTGRPLDGNTGGASRTSVRIAEAGSWHRVPRESNVAKGDRAKGVVRTHVKRTALIALLARVVQEPRRGRSRIEGHGGKAKDGGSKKSLHGLIPFPRGQGEPSRPSS